MQLKDNKRCYVCGEDNPSGLRVRFDFDPAARTVQGAFTPAARHEGWEGIVHGGILSTLLDESMVKLAACLGIRAVSAELTVKFRAPAAPGDDLVVTAAITRESRRLLETEARVMRGPVIIAEAAGKLLRTGS